MTTKSETGCCKPQSPILLKRPNQIQVAKVGVWGVDYFGLKALRYILNSFDLKHMYLSHLYQLRQRLLRQNSMKFKDSGFHKQIKP